ncbi:MAG: hypothetical protein H6656_10540 [Ardenticatenaceae bacterium]|nr:hypothetical protein [Ardenticatenaceae bacterium]
MKRWFWGTAVSLMVLLFATVSCGSGSEESEALPDIAGPAFVLFYTDN